MLSFVRQTADGANQLAVILNLTPVPREKYRVGLPHAGTWREVLNSDAGVYAGGNLGNLGGVTAENVPCHQQQHSAEFFLPPMSALVFRRNSCRLGAPASRRLNRNAVDSKCRRAGGASTGLMT